MKRTDLFTNITGVLLFVALLCYIGAYLWRAAVNPVQTAVAVIATVRESFDASGIVLRDEQIIESSIRHLDIVAAQGARVASGETIAVAYEDEQSLARANQIRVLELEALKANTILDIAASEDLTAKNGALRTCLFAISRAIMRHELDDLDSQTLRFSSLVFENAGHVSSHEELEALMDELSTLRSMASSGTEAIEASRPGVFSTLLDGYEHLSLTSVQGLTPSGLRDLFDDRREISERAVGKLITSPKWYFAAVMDANHAEIISASPHQSEIELEFGRHYLTPLSANLESTGISESGECVLVFSFDEALAGTLTMRQATAQIMYAEYSGFRIPSAAVRYSDSGQAFVYTLTGLKAVAVDVEIIYEEEDYCLVTSTDDSGMLHEGNEIIVRAKDLYDGKVMN